MQEAKAAEKYTIKQLMLKTAPLRKKWIMEEGPLVSEILKKFPALREPRAVSSSVYVVIFLDINHFTSYGENLGSW